MLPAHAESVMISLYYWGNDLIHCLFNSWGARTETGNNCLNGAEIAWESDLDIYVGLIRITVPASCLPAGR
jgi:hypothetical protein